MDRREPQIALRDLPGDIGRATRRVRRQITGRSSATRSLNTVSPRVQPIRSAITVAGILGYACSNSRMRGSTSSTIDPAGVRSYFGGTSEAIAARTVFLETPNTRTIALIGNPSARCSLRISAQSSTDNTPSSPSARISRESAAGGQNSGVDTGSSFRRRRHPAIPVNLRCISTLSWSLTADDIFSLEMSCLATALRMPWSHCVPLGTALGNAGFCETNRVGIAVRQPGRQQVGGRRRCPGRFTELCSEVSHAGLACAGLFCEVRP